MAILKLYFSKSPSFYVSGYNLKLIVGQKLWLLTVIGFMTWLHLWYGTVARMTLPPSPGQSPLSISSNPGSVRVQSGKCANLCCRSPWRWVVVKKSHTPPACVHALYFISICLSGCWPCCLQTQPLRFSGSFIPLTYPLFYITHAGSVSVMDHDCYSHLRVWFSKFHLTVTVFSLLKLVC